MKLPFLLSFPCVVRLLFGFHVRLYPEDISIYNDCSKWGWLPWTKRARAEFFDRANPRVRIIMFLPRPDTHKTNQQHELKNNIQAWSSLHCWRLI